MASEERLAFLRRVTGPASKQAGFLDSYRFVREYTNGADFWSHLPVQTSGLRLSRILSLYNTRTRTKAAAGASTKRRRVASGGGVAKALAGLAGAGEDDDEEEGGGEYEDEEVEGAFLKGKEGSSEARKGALTLDEDYDDE